MRLRPSNVIPAVSLVLCIITILIGVRSFWIGNSIVNWRVSVPARQFTIREFGAEAGRIGLFRLKSEYDSSDGFAEQLRSFQLDTLAQNAPPFPQTGTHHHSWSPTVPVTSALLFRPTFDHQHSNHESFGIVMKPQNVFRRVGTYSVTQDRLSLPFWYLSLPLFFVGLPLLLRIRRQIRLARSGRCSSCAYDLTGNTSGVCPECGRPITP